MFLEVQVPSIWKEKKIDTNDSRIQTCTTQMVQYNALTRICWTKEKKFKYI